MKCLRCGYINHAESESCGSCGFPLCTDTPKPYYFQLKYLSQDIIVGAVSAEEFSESLSHMSHLLDDMHRMAVAWDEYMKSADLPDIAAAVIARPMRTLKEGIDVFEQALNTLRFYVSDPEENHLIAGLELADKACNILNACTDLAGYAYREVKKQIPAEMAPSDEEVRKMMTPSPASDGDAAPAEDEEAGEGEGLPQEPSLPPEEDEEEAAETEEETLAVLDEPEAICSSGIDVIDTNVELAFEEEEDGGEKKDSIDIKD